MAVRTPLYWDGTGLAEMTAAMVTDCVDETIRQYGLDPSVTVSYVASGGTMGTISDTRLKSGTSHTSAVAFPSEATTGEPQTVTTNYARMTGPTSATVSTPADTANKAFPVFYDSGTGTIQAMSLTDMRDTFVAPALARLVTGGYTSSVGDHDGMFFISASNAAATNHALVDATPVFQNTQADTASYLASNIGTSGTTQDFSTTINSYYLRKFQRSGGASSYLGPTTPMQINGSNDLQAFTEANFGTILQDAIRDAAVNVVGSRITYSLVTTVTGTAMGTGMADTKLNGSGNYQQRYVNANDYRAQEFPNGTAVAQNTHYLQASLF